MSSPSLGAHVVLIVNRLPSLVNTSLGAAKRLERAGFRTTVVCTPNLAERLGAEGLTVAVVEHDERFAELADADPPPAPTNPVAFVAWIRRRRRLRAESAASTEIADVVRALDPDLLLINAETHLAMIVTRPLGIPTLATTNFFSVFRGSGLPPLSMTTAPASSGPDRIRLWAAWLWIRAGTKFDRIRRRAGRAGLAGLVRPIRTDTVELGELKQVAKAAGVDLAAITDRSHWLRPHVYSNLPLVSFTAAEMELPHRPDDRIVYVGPMLEPGRVERPPATGDAERLAEMQRVRVGDQGRPLVYCSLGTVWSANRRFLRLVLQVFDTRRDWNLVLSLGGADRHELDLGPIPPNALVLDWAPQIQILAEADCFITHGGVKSLSEAVHFEVPVVTYSTGFVDQNGNARRVAHHGLGVMGDASSASAADIEADVEQALTDPGMHDALAAMNAHFGTYEAGVDDGRAGELVDLVRRSLATTQR